MRTWLQWGVSHKQGQDQSQQKKNNVPPSLATLKLVLSYNACGHCDTCWYASRKTVMDIDDIFYNDFKLSTPSSANSVSCSDQLCIAVVH